jgi:hypothetical protein
MIVILPPERYDDWLKAPAGDSAAFLQAWPVGALQAKASLSGIAGRNQ